MLHAPLPHSVRGPVAVSEQALPHLPGGHRDAALQRRPRRVRRQSRQVRGRVHVGHVLAVAGVAVFRVGPGTAGGRQLAAHPGGGPCSSHGRAWAVIQ